jgi:hypothetical protein
MVFDNGNIHGGDNRYLYRGHYIVEGNSLTAKIQASYYRMSLGFRFPLVFNESLDHPSDLVGIPHGIHDILGVSRVTDEIEVGGLAAQGLVQSPLRP